MRKDWSETAFGDIASVQSGFAFSAKDWTENGYPVIKINNVRDGKVSLDSCSFISDPIPKGSEKFQLRRGDLLITLTGEIGATGTVSHDGPLFLNQRVGKITVVNENNATIEFVAYLLSNQKLRNEMWSLGKGNAQLNISPSSIHGLSVLLPPLAEQKRIVDVVSSVDAYIDALQQQVDSARTARNAVLHDLLSAGGDDWTETTLGDISTFVSKRKSPKELALDTPYVGLEHVEPKTTLISNWGSVESVSSSVTPFEPEDTLFGRLRPYLHKVAFADVPGVCSPEILVLRSSAKCEAKFLYLLCSLDSTVKECVEMSAGTRMPRTSTTDLASIKVQLPPLAEQKRIVELVSSIDEVIQSTEQAFVDAKALRSGMLSDLLSGNHEIPASYDSLLGVA